MIEKLARYKMIIGFPLALSISILADQIMVPLARRSIRALGRHLASADLVHRRSPCSAMSFSMGLLIQNQQRRLLLIRGVGLALNASLTAVLLLNWGDPRGAVIASIIGEFLVVLSVSQRIPRCLA